MENQEADPIGHEQENPPSSTEDLDDVVATSATHAPKQIYMTDEELRRLQKEILDYKDKYLRLLADGENSRKRLQKEKLEISRYATENLVIDFLRPIDNFENALRFAQEMSDEVKNWAFGFQMILTQFKDVLAQHGVTPFESIGHPFNPHDHEAIEMVESIDYPSGHIIEESMRGYSMGDRTIRVARVKVAKAPEKLTTEKN